MKYYFSKKRCILKFASFFITTILCFSLNPAFSLDDKNTNYVNELISQAKTKNLANSKYWYILIHYKKTFSGIESLIDDKKFFIAADGKYNPESELEETIKIFFQFDPFGENHPGKKFIARYLWLKKELNIDENLLPCKFDEEFNKTIDLIKPESVSIIFPSAYINSPASMYGHTFLLVNLKNKTKLLSASINYAAAANDPLGLTYAYKGLFGLYPGYFTLLPYYEKIREYSELEKRDIWEYKLNLNEEETIRLLAHVIELSDIYSDYYFLTENCSYNLLFLLEAARPEVSLVDKCPKFVAPVDTIRVCVDENLISEEPYFRPSATTKINHLIEKLSEKNKTVPMNLIYEKITPEDLSNGDEKENAIICDLAIEYLSYLYNSREINNATYSKKVISLMNARSKIKEVNNFSDLKSKTQSPEKGHPPNKISIGTGWTSYYGLFQEIGYRPTYHKLTDPSIGYIDGGEITLGDVLLRYNSQEKLLKFQKFDLLNLISIVPSNRYLMIESIKFNIGLNQKIMKNDNSYLNGHSNFGYGYSYNFSNFGFLYFFGEADLNINQYENKYFSLGPGLTFGTLNSFFSFWKYNLYTENYYYALWDRYPSLSVNFQNGFTITNDFSIKLNFKYSRIYGNNYNEISLSGDYFF